MRKTTMQLKYYFFILIALFTIPVFAFETDLYGGDVEVKGKAIGWFHVEKLNDRWFFVTPDGNAFFSLGVTHTGETIRQDEIGSSPACIGLHRCTIRDYYPWNPQFHRRGLLKADDSPYLLLTESTRETNASVMSKVYHRGD